MSWRRWLLFWRPEKGPSPELEAAQRKLDEVASKDPEVFHLAEQLRRIRSQNNFAALFGSTFRDRR
jgi:hypothetical protein